MFQDNKISAAKFNTYANASRALCQIFYWLMAAPANTATNHPVSISVATFLPAEPSNQLLARSNEKLMAIQRTVDNNPAVPGNDAFEQVAHQIISYLQELINHL